ncbi:hypothetical protein PPERSA_10162 [Pseudocohnilembus persalinus]|uniref:Uncharacterized protein n=1 Tax=Pseudocohnilembus persalinus TaxID=266149 RepID=A0A0V0QL58_PSEPJ|nr:hypothetical protein PPERSA_10162 [Pseudocohnilembus persalinus]|eukprot:KRX03081.1 hypothetical protein PPERSA_10162 [Pseudocohnilembus persalinus]
MELVQKQKQIKELQEELHQWLKPKKIFKPKKFDFLWFLGLQIKLPKKRLMKQSLLFNDKNKYNNNMAICANAIVIDEFLVDNQNFNEKYQKYQQIWQSVLDHIYMQKNQDQFRKNQDGNSYNNIHGDYYKNI